MICLYDFLETLTHKLTLLEYISRQAEQVRKGGLPPLPKLIQPKFKKQRG